MSVLSLFRTPEAFQALLGTQAFIQGVADYVDYLVIGETNLRVFANRLGQGRFIAKAKVAFQPRLDCHERRP